MRPRLASPNRASALAALLPLLAQSLLSGCGHAPVRPALPNGGKDPTALAKCSVAASQSSPLVTEWPASEKANLEARLREGGVVVAYSGCQMRLLTQCKAKGSYEWQRTTLATDTVEIRNEDDLYAKLPLGAASLEGELKSSGRLAVRTTVAGQMKLKGLATGDVPRDGDCAGATHVVSGLSVGAFKLLAGGDASAKAGAGAGGVGIGGSTSSEEVLVKEAGDPAKCGEANDEHPASACQSPIQIFLWPLPKQVDASGVAEDSDTPPTPDAVRVNFMAVNEDEKWRVMQGSKVLCDAPCTRWVRPNSGISMRRDGARASDTVTIPLAQDLGGYSPGRTIDAVANAASGGGAAGLGLTILGGTVLTVGAALLILEEVNSPRLDRLYYPGVVASAIGGSALPIGIVLLATSRFADGVDLTLAPNQTTSRPRLRLGPGFVTADTGGRSNVSMTLGPGFLTGQF